MTHLLVALALALSQAPRATDDCTFDQVHQSNVVAAIAKMIPGGATDPATRTITWTRPGEGTTTFGFGGCVDLGSVVTRTTALPRSRTQAQILALARDLSARFWRNTEVSGDAAAEALTRATERAEFVVEQSGSRTVFNVADPGYVQLYVEHEYINGIDRVVIAWQGHF